MYIPNNDPTITTIVPPSVQILSAQQTLKKLRSYSFRERKDNIPQIYFKIDNTDLQITHLYLVLHTVSTSKYREISIKSNTLTRSITHLEIFSSLEYEMLFIKSEHLVVLLVCY